MTISPTLPYKTGFHFSKNGMSKDRKIVFSALQHVTYMKTVGAEI